MKVHVVNRKTGEKKILEVDGETEFHCQLIASSRMIIEVENPKDWFVEKVEE